METAIHAPPRTSPVQSPEAVVFVLQDESKEECLWVLHLDRDNQVVEKERMKVFAPFGLAPREILRKAVTNGAARVITVRVPSNGTTELVLEDVQLWRTLGIACESLGIGFVDHLVVSGSGRHVSCRETVRAPFRKEADGYRTKQGRQE